MGKKFYNEKKTLLKKTFYREKYKWKCKKYLISNIFFIKKMFVLQIKYKYFLNIYSFCKNKFFDHKKYIC